VQAGSGFEKDLSPAVQGLLAAQSHDALQQWWRHSEPCAAAWQLRLQAKCKRGVVSELCHSELTRIYDKGFRNHACGSSALVLCSSIFMNLMLHIIASIAKG
jgi:hypothetical protein